MSRQSRRAFQRALEKAKKGNITEAKVTAFRVGFDGPQTVAADVECGCGKVFRFNKIQAPDFVRDPSKIGDLEEASATTGEWSEGGCPGCGKAHRVRATTVVVVEEEDTPRLLLTKGGLILPR